MQPSILNRENLDSLFRSLSQKRKSGVVHIKSEDSHFEIIFESGRLVEVMEVGWFSSPAIYERLRISGRLFGEILDHEQLSQMDISTLYSNLVALEHVSHDDFTIARRALAVDMLRSLYFSSTGVFQFDSKIKPFDSRLSLMLSPNQLLLDFAEFEEDEGRYNEFVSNLSDLSLGFLSDGNIESLTVQETELLRAIGVGGDLEDIVSCALLSENDYRRALLSLYDKGVISPYPLAPVSSSEIADSRSSLPIKSTVSISIPMDTYGPMFMAAGVIAGVALVLPLRVDSFLGGVENLMKVFK